MALITDPDQLNDGTTDNGSTEVFINTTAKTIKLNTLDAAVRHPSQTGRASRAYHPGIQACHRVMRVDEVLLQVR